MKTFHSIPSSPSPVKNYNVITWLHQNMLSSWFDALLTIFLLFLFVLAVKEFWNWAVFDAVWVGTLADGVVEKCRAASGACWPFVGAHLSDFIYGFYPETERWRIDIGFLSLVVLVAAFFVDFFNKSVIIFLMVGVYPICSFFLLFGGMGLVPVGTAQLSGFSLTLLLSILGIFLAFPLGIILALMRISKLPVFRITAIMVIEFFRSSPLVALFFMASIMFPFFLPTGIHIDLVWRVLFVIVIFEASYIAEAIRGGIQAVPVSQHEAAQSIGLSYFKTMFFVILPQSLKIALPGIVNVFIALFKDTSLISIVGMFEFIRMVKNSILDPKWTIDSSVESYIFVGFVYWVFCFSMSQYAHHIEKKLEKGSR